VLATANEMGGKNEILGIIYFTAGGFCFGAIVILFFTNLIKQPGRVEKLDNLRWK